MVAARHRAARMLKRRPARVLTDTDLWTPAEMARDPFYQEFRRQNRLGRYLAYAAPSERQMFLNMNWPTLNGRTASE